MNKSNKAMEEAKIRDKSRSKRPDDTAYRSARCLRMLDLLTKEKSLIPGTKEHYELTQELKAIRAEATVDMCNDVKQISPKSAEHSLITMKKDLVQYRVDFFFEPSTLPGYSNEKVAHNIATRMLYNMNDGDTDPPAIHIGTPKYMGTTAETTIVPILN